MHICPTWGHGTSVQRTEVPWLQLLCTLLMPVGACGCVQTNDKGPHLLCRSSMALCIGSWQSLPCCIEGILSTSSAVQQDQFHPNKSKTRNNNVCLVAMLCCFCLVWVRFVCIAELRQSAFTQVVKIYMEVYFASPSSIIRDVKVKLALYCIHLCQIMPDACCW